MSGPGGVGSRGVNLFGVERILTGGPGELLDLVSAADDLGVGHVVHTDHVVMGERTDRYPYGRFPVPPEHPWPEPLTVLAAMAARTSRIRLGTAVLIGPLRPATLLAKTAATLDVLSAGRLDLGLGAGWQREEFEAAGVPFAERFDRLDDTVGACRSLWSPGPASFRSPSVEFDGVWCEPSPVRPGGPALWFGGPAAGRNARRIAAWGRGWLPVGSLSPERLAGEVATLQAALADAGRRPDELAVRSGLPVRRGTDGRPSLEASLDGEAELRAAGASEVTVNLAAYARTRRELHDALAELAGG